MKRVLLLSMAVLLVASVSWAQFPGGTIGIYTDAPGYSLCDLTEAVGAPNDVYVVHVPGVVGKGNSNTSQFMVEDTWGAFRAGENTGTNLWLGSTAGNTIYEGGTVTYVGCKPLPHLLITLTMIPFSASGDCGGSLTVIPDPSLPSLQIETVDCDGSTVAFADGGRLNVNDGGNCPLSCGPVATEDTSWSRIKAMYK